MKICFLKGHRQPNICFFFFISQTSEPCHIFPNFQSTKIHLQILHLPRSQKRKLVQNKFTLRSPKDFYFAPCSVCTKYIWQFFIHVNLFLGEKAKQKIGLHGEWWINKMECNLRCWKIFWNMWKSIAEFEEHRWGRIGESSCAFENGLWSTWPERNYGSAFACEIISKGVYI